MGCKQILVPREIRGVKKPYTEQERSLILYDEWVNQMLDEYHLSLKNNEKPLIHSDRGAYYRWPEWIEKKKKVWFHEKYVEKGCSPDNAACEGFFGRMKHEMFYGRKWEGVSIESFIQIVNEYII